MRFSPFIPALVWVIIITVLSGYPGRDLPKAPFDEFDKLVHLVIYAMLSGLILLGFLKNQKTTTLYCWISIVIATAYGGIVELLQQYIFINRYGDWYDFLANTLGAILGIVIIKGLLSFNLLKINKS